MNCIFCDENGMSEEHIIPRNVGGSIVIWNVCQSCNSILGSAVDSELNRHSHIHDGWLKIPKELRPNLNFQFIDRWVEMENGEKIHITPKNEIVPKKVFDKYFVIPMSDNTSPLNILKKTRPKMTAEELEVFKKKLDEFTEIQQPGDIFIDHSSGIMIKVEEHNTPVHHLMNAKTPHRFMAKVAYEVIREIGWQDEIAETELLKMHAIKGGQYDNLCFREDVGCESAVCPPTHVIKSFLNDCDKKWYFAVDFFGYYSVGVAVTWLTEPHEFNLVDVLTTYPSKGVEIIKGKYELIRLNEKQVMWKLIER